ncbi:hypothetical protein BpHYR1_007796, partial [Brachionus plicatilis]
LPFENIFLSRFCHTSAFTYASESQEKSDIDDILDKIESISKVEWDGESKTLILKKIDNHNWQIVPNAVQRLLKFDTLLEKFSLYQKKLKSNRESNSSSNECRQHFSSSDSNEENYAHPEDILWEYDAILNERNIDAFHFSSWENESMVNCIFSRKRRLPVKKLVHIEEIDKPTEIF